jgi:hypothetical protein
MSSSPHPNVARTAPPPAKAAPPAFDATKFLTPASSNFPIMVDYWKQALTCITANPSSLRAQEHIGFALPDPRIFFSDINRTAYLLTWMSIRFGHFYKLDQGSKGSDSVNSQQWKLGLNTFRGLLQPTPTPNPNTPAPSNNHRGARKGSRREKNQSRTMNTYLDTLLSHFKYTPNVEWFGKTFSVSSPDAFTTNLPCSVSAEIIWEITELSFRRELRVLDAYLLPSKWSQTAEAIARDEMVRRVFPLYHGVTCPSYTLGEYPNEDDGLLSSSLTERCRAFMAFRQLVSSWP